MNQGPTSTNRLRRMRALIMTLACGLSLQLGASLALADDWPQWLGPQRDGIWRESGIVDQFPEGGPDIVWRTPTGGGYAGPAVANGRVYLLDRHLAPNAENPSNPFGRGKIPGTERILCLNEQTGEIEWEHEYSCTYTMSFPAGPRTTPVIDEGNVYTLGAEGDLFCLTAKTGKVVWSRDFKEDFGVETPLWGFSAHPLIDGDKLICLVGGDGTTAVAFDKKTGQEIWSNLSSTEPGYCPPVIYKAGGVRQLMIWHPEAVNSLNPNTGKVYWSHQAKIKSGLTIPTPRKMGSSLFLTSFYNGSMMFRLASEEPKAKLVWETWKTSAKDTRHINSIISTPFLEDGYIYGVDSYGEFRCLEAKTGKRLWKSMKPTTGDEKARWANAFIVKNDDRYFLFNEQGDLIIAKLTPDGYHEIDRAHLLEPTNKAGTLPRKVVWSHPAFAHQRIYVRNDNQIICADLAADRYATSK